MRYYIGEHDGIEHPFDHNTYRAYFYWREGDIPRTQSFSVEGLKEHIAACRADGVLTHKFELALACHVAHSSGLNSPMFPVLWHHPFG